MIDHVKIARTLKRLQTEVGHTGKRRHVKLATAEVMKHLYGRGFFYDFNPNSQEEKDFKLDGIFARIAYDMGMDERFRPISNPGIFQRCDSARLHRKKVMIAVRRFSLFLGIQVAIVLRSLLLTLITWSTNRKLQKTLPCNATTNDFAVISSVAWRISSA
jgi:hypothetical protein